MEDIIRQMMCTNRGIRRFMDAVTESLKLSTSQGRILIYIEGKNKEVTAQEIASEFNMKRSTVSEHIKLLENLGYVIRIDASLDKRKKWIHITSAGKEIVKEMKIRFNKNEKYLESLLTEDEQKIFVEILKKIRMKLKEDYNV